MKLCLLFAISILGIRTSSVDSSIMLEPLELSLSPSGSNCISWSVDGDLAIAAGELVYILTPKIQAQAQAQPQQEAGFTLGAGAGAGAPANAQWNITKIKSSVFTEEEFPSIFPEAGSSFSLGHEQSLSHVVALSWSLPGLAAYGRCILGVLTSSLILSFWQADDGSSKWSRVLVVNHSLRDYFMLKVGVDADLVARKHRIRAFSWSHTLDRDGDEGSLRRARNFLVVGNDMGDVVFLKVRDRGMEMISHDNHGAGGYEYSRVEVLSHHSLDESRIPPSIEPYSLFASSLQARAAITDVLWGQWVRANEKDDRHTAPRYQALTAVVKGSELDILRVETKFGMGGEDQDAFKCHGSIIGSQGLRAQLEPFAFKGPLYWIPKYDAEFTALAVGILGGCIILVIRRRVIEDVDHDFQESDITIHKEIFDSNSAGWHAPLGFTSISDSSDSNVASHLYMTTSSSFTKCIKLPILRQEHFLSMDDITPPHPPWQKQIDSFKNRFDLDYDLGGTAMAKTWGLAKYLGWIAVGCSFHPTDMVQHITASKERLTVVFAPPTEEQEDQDHTAVGMPWHAPQLNHRDMQRGRAQILRFTLGQRDVISGDGHNQLSKMLIYAASCCAILDQPPLESDLLDEARQSLEWMSDKTGLDLNQEISTIDLVSTKNADQGPELQDEMEVETETEANSGVNIAPAHNLPKPTIAPKSEEELQYPGARGIFEVCDICTSGIEWYSPIESQCKEGHMFVRCGLTFLSIQDPSISKRCSRCDGEFIDEAKLVAQYQIGRDMDKDPDVDIDMDSTNIELLSRIAERFPSCVYCGGKFKV